MSIKRGDYAIIQGINVKLYSEAGNPDAVVRTAQSGENIGTATGATQNYRQNTYIEILVPVVSGNSPVGYNFNLVYVDAEFVTGKTNPGYDASKDKTGSPLIPINNDNIHEQTVGDKTVTDTQQNGSVPVDLGNGKVIYVKIDTSGVGTGTNTPANNTDTSAATKWVKYGIIGVVAVAVIALIYTLTKSKTA